MEKNPGQSMMRAFEFESLSHIEQSKLFDFILTQASLNGRAPYDLIESVITQSIHQVKALSNPLILGHAKNQSKTLV
ncbi:MAG: hypothetical protein WCR08_05980, partial [Gammaproteobacteria bacterium]